MRKRAVTRLDSTHVDRSRHEKIEPGLVIEQRLDELVKVERLPVLPDGVLLEAAQEDGTLCLVEEPSGLQRRGGHEEEDDKGPCDGDRAAEVVPARVSTASFS